jgi:para-aminobenzoate synthetase component 1
VRARFENRLTHRAIELTDFVDRIAVSEASALPSAFAAIERAQKAGHWVALILDYSLGEWLEPALRTDATRGAPTERLVALVARQRNLGSTETPETKDTDPLPTSQALTARVASISPGIDLTRYAAMVADIQRRIAAGDLYQVNATFPLNVQTLGTSYDLYRHIASRHPSEHAAYIEDTHRSILSFSPELFLSRTGNRLMTKPMKGTAPRVLDDPEKDQQRAQALQESEKNRAENLMIVDLLRNDMGRLALPGSIRVNPLFELEAYPSVWTMTSTIEATLPRGTSLAEIVYALFPCGSVTGAPKIAAMRCIDELETYPRGVYCGSIGWLAPDGDFSLNVAIRTLVLDKQGHGAYHVGGGIVHDSQASDEWEECFWKARVIEPEPNA